MWGFNVDINEDVATAAKDLDVAVATFDVLDDLLTELQDARARVVETEAAVLRAALTDDNDDDDGGDDDDERRDSDTSDSAQPVR